MIKVKSFVSSVSYILSDIFYKYPYLYQKYQKFINPSLIW